MVNGQTNSPASGRRLFGLVAALLPLLLFLGLAIAVYRGQAIALDETIRQTVRPWAAPSLAPALKSVSFFGSQRFLIAGLLVVSIVFVALQWKRAVIVLLIAMAGQALLEMGLKSIFERPRPQPFYDYPPLESYSFPSGHALSSVCFYGIVAWLIAKRLPNGRWRFSLWMLTAALVGLIGASRVLLGVHYPSDVLAGLAAGAVWIFAVAASGDRLEKNDS